jgi:hypothetical protein
MVLYYCIIDDDYSREARFAATKKALHRRLLYSYIDGRLSDGAVEPDVADEIRELTSEGNYEQAVKKYQFHDTNLIFGTDEIEWARSPARIRDGFGPGLEIEYNFTEDGLVIDIHNVVEGEVVWSMSFTHSELVGLISDQFDDLEFPTI